MLSLKKLFHILNRATMYGIALPFFIIIAEQRIIHYYFFGNRSASLVDFLIFCFMFFIVFALLYVEKYRVMRGELKKYTVIMLPLLLMLVFYSGPSSSLGIGDSFPRLTFILLMCYMLATVFFLLKLEESILVDVLYLGSMAAAAIFFVIFIGTRWRLNDVFLYGQGTPALNFPFGNPNQAGFFLLVVFALGVGIILDRKNNNSIYFFVPAVIISIFQTGSRSAFLLLALSTVSLFLSIILKSAKKGVFFAGNFFRFLLSLIIGVVFTLLFSYVGEQSQAIPSPLRAISVLDNGILEIASVSVDSARSEIWTSISNNDTKQLVYSENGPVGAHNAYLDLWANWGVWALVCFIVFFLGMVFFSADLFLLNVGKKSHYFYSSILIVTIMISGAIYVNPILHLKMPWLFFGLVVALWIKSHSFERAEQRCGNGAAVL